MRVILMTSLFATVLTISCSAQGTVPILPDLAKSPGAIDPALSQDVICRSDFSTKTLRKGSKADRSCVLSRYGGRPAYAFMYDHVIPLEIGGADNCDNLWPEPRAEAKLKDKAEDAMYARVCVCHDLTLSQAQDFMRSNWRLAYARYVTRKGAKICDVNVLPSAPGR